MVQIFVTGATGYIGFEVALALRRAGHSVYALTRTSNSQLAIALLHNEVNLVVGDILKSDTYIDVAISSSVLIHVAADYSQFDKVDAAATDAFLEASNKSNEKGGGRKLIIYTGGILVYPGSNDISTEETSLDESIAFLSGRRATEQRYLKSTEADGVVIRPGYVFGKRPTAPFYNFFDLATKGEEVYTTTNLDVAWSLIHVDDLASAYVAVVDSARDKIKGQIFNVTDNAPKVTNVEIARTFGALAGWKGPITSHPEKGWPVANKTVLASSKKLTDVTGWVVKHKPILEEAELHYNHWKATVAHPYPTSAPATST